MGECIGEFAFTAAKLTEHRNIKLCTIDHCPRAECHNEVGNMMAS